MKRKKQAHHKHFCPCCFVSGKGAKTFCVKCSGELIIISHKFHLPSPSASKAKWKKFFEESNFLNTGRLNEAPIKVQVLKTLEEK